MGCGGGQGEGVGAVVFCPCLDEVHKELRLWDKQCPVLSSPLQALFVDVAQYSAVLLSQFPKRQGIHVVNKAGSKGRVVRGLQILVRFAL